MPMNPQFQLSLELSNVFQLGTLAKSTGSAIVKLARELRISGSDLVVEEDLANVFGRGTIVSEVESRFRKNVLKDTRIIPLYPGAEIQLCSGAGPTVSRALREKDRRYLSTVIQLSLLAWMHDMTDLASSLVDCMTKRAHIIPDADVSPDFESVVGTLEACSSQTSSFAWDSYIQYVESRLREHMTPGLLYQSYGHISGLSPTLLLAAMDALYLVQSLPEDRLMMTKGQQGIIPLIVWAHCVLGLTVSVQIPQQEDLVFGQDQNIQLVICVLTMGSRAVDTKEEVLLLDRDMTIILRYTAENHEERINVEERHLLRNYGTDYLRRKMNCDVTTLDSDAVYPECIKLTMALSLSLSTRLEHASEDEEPSEACSLFSGLHLERWRVLDAVDVMFEDFLVDRRIDKKAADNFIALIEDRPICDVTPPQASIAYIERVAKSLQQSDEAREAIKQDRLQQYRTMIVELTHMVLTFAHVVGVKDCREIPLLFNLGRASTVNIIHQMRVGQKTLQVEQDDFLQQAIKFLLGEPQLEKVADNAFVVSQFGWSIILGSVGDKDPGEVRPSLFNIKRGIPTNVKTNERKSFITDGSGWINNMQIVEVVDRGDYYSPRCLTPVTERIEYYTSRAREFQLTVRNTIQNAKGQKSFRFSASYHEMHSSLWNVWMTNSCSHSGIRQDAAALGLDVVTTSGFQWDMENEGLPEGTRIIISERICISLVKDDPRARWLAVISAARSNERQTVLRANGCCENCALHYTAALPDDKYVLII